MEEYIVFKTVFIAIAQGYSQINDPQKAEEGLKKVVQAVEQRVSLTFAIRGVYEPLSQ